MENINEKLEIQISDLCKRAKDSARAIASADTGKKNEVLLRLASLLRENIGAIINANEEDLDAGRSAGLTSALLDRLMLDEKRINGIADSLVKLVSLPDPIGTGEHFTRPNGLKIDRIRVPLGVVGIIYEARPNVTVDAAALCIKTGNAVVLRGGKEAIRTNIKLSEIISSALSDCGFSPDTVGLVKDTTRESSKILMCMRGLLDVIIPRGGAGLIKSVTENATVPVIETGAGNCHLYVDCSADLEIALAVAINAKASRPSVCNAIENLIVHSAAAKDFLPKFAEEAKRYNIEIRGCKCTKEIIPDILDASEEDFYTEYNDYIISVKIVDSLEEAIEHINQHSTGHSEAIITSELDSAEKFQLEVDSAAVYVNASTRFTDGGEFGFGAEIGISTQKLHARGPMGLYALTTEKYLIRGNGQIR